MVIVSASGMLSGGRILHHLQHRLSNPETTLLFVGFQAAGTLGRRILEGAHEVRIHGQPIVVRAEIRDIPALSNAAEPISRANTASESSMPRRPTLMARGRLAARARAISASASAADFKITTRES